MYSVLPPLRRQFLKQLPSGAILLNFVIQFVDVVTHGYQKNLGQDFFVAAQQELSESIILFDDAKGTFHLNGSVHPQQSAFFTADAFQRLLTLLDECFGDLKLPIAL